MGVDWQWTGSGLVVDWQWTGSRLAVGSRGLSVGWHGLAPYCTGLALDWHRLGAGHVESPDAILHGAEGREAARRPWLCHQAVSACTLWRSEMGRYCRRQYCKITVVHGECFVSVRQLGRVVIRGLHSLG